MKVAKNFFYNLIYQLLNLALPIITIPYVVKVLTKSQIGLNSFIGANVSYFILFGMLGISMYGSREIAKNKSDKKKLNNTFFSIYKVQFIAHVISMFFYILLFVVVFPSDKMLNLIYVIQIISSMLDISWLYAGLEEFKTISIRSSLVRLIGTLCTFLFVKESGDFYTYVIVMLLPQAILQIYMIYDSKRFISYERIWKTKISNSDFVGIILLFIPQVAISIYAILDKTMLGYITTLDDVAIYDQGQKIIRMVLSIVPALSMVLMPRIAKLIVDKNQEKVSMYMESSAKVIWFISFGLTFGLIGISSNFVPWFYGKDYLEVIDLFKITSYIFIAVGGSNLISVQFLIPSGRQNQYTISVIIAAIINFVMNLLLIPKFSVYGACFASVSAEFSAFIIQCIYARKYLNIRLIFSDIYKPLMSGVLMSGVLLIANEFFAPSLMNTLLLVIIGFTIYLVSLILLNYANVRKYLIIKLKVKNKEV